MSDPEHISIAEAANAPHAAVEKLRAQAARYRALAETLFDPNVLTVVLECARELEAEANSLEQKQFEDAGRLR